MSDLRCPARVCAQYWGRHGLWLWSTMPTAVRSALACACGTVHTVLAAAAPSLQSQILHRLSPRCPSLNTQMRMHGPCAEQLVAGSIHASTRGLRTTLATTFDAVTLQVVLMGPAMAPLASLRHEHDGVGDGDGDGVVEGRRA